MQINKKIKHIKLQWTATIRIDWCTGCATFRQTSNIQKTSFSCSTMNCTSWEFAARFKSIKPHSFLKLFFFKLSENSSFVRVFGGFNRMPVDAVFVKFLFYFCETSASVGTGFRFCRFSCCTWSAPLGTSVAAFACLSFETVVIGNWCSRKIE